MFLGKRKEEFLYFTFETEALAQKQEILANLVSSYVSIG